jgi:hypothetical protein
MRNAVFRSCCSFDDPSIGFVVLPQILFTHMNAPMSKRPFTARLLARAASGGNHGVPRDRLMDVQLAAAFAFHGKLPDERVVLSIALASLEHGGEIIDRAVLGVTPSHIELDDGTTWPACDTAYAQVAAQLVSPLDMDGDAASLSADVSVEHEQTDDDNDDGNCFSDLGPMHPAAESLVGTIRDCVVDGAPMLHVPGWTWLFEQRRGAFAVACMVPPVLLFLALLIGGRMKWGRNTHAAFHVAIFSVWCIHAMLIVTQYQRGVVAIVVRTYDFWYISCNFAVFFTVGWAEYVITYDLPVWVFVTLPPWCVCSSLVGLCSDGMPDHRFRSAFMTMVFVVLAFLTLQLLLFSPIRNAPIHTGFTFQTTWGAVAGTSGATLLAFFARTLLKSAFGKDLLVVVGLERLSRRRRREAASRNVQGHPAPSIARKPIGDAT